MQVKAFITPLRVLSVLLLVACFAGLNSGDSIALLSAIAITAVSVLLALILVFGLAVALLVVNEQFGGVRRLILLIPLLPQIVWLMIGYSFVNSWIVGQGISDSVTIFLSASLFAFVLLPEVFQFLEERLAHEKEHGAFFPLQTHGVSLPQLVIREVLWRQNRAHVLLKMCALVGSVFFLQISIEFIISVGLSETIGVINFPLSLGQLLTQIGSKQDLLAVGYALFSPSYGPTLLTQHLFGLSVAISILLGMIGAFKLSSFATEKLDA